MSSILQQMLREAAEQTVTSERTFATTDKNLDIVDFDGDAVPHEYWTEGLFYRGVNIYKAVYDNDVYDLVADAETRIKRNNDNITDVQECYLGYNKKKDLFLLGFDGWGTEESDYDYDDDSDDGGGEEDFNCSPFCTFKLKDGKPQIVEVGSDYGHSGATWYSHSKYAAGGYKAAKSNNFISIRLD